MKSFLKAWGFTFFCTWIVFLVSRYHSDFSILKQIMIQAAGALGFTLNPLILILISATVVTYKKFKGSLNGREQKAT